ncbi:single-stranded DNA-binding protein [Actinoplanes aureus]|uniref:Single-stranded DNA-binding protein n=1 Tax=Actinoplanes aureus TaxID=2792083 RepID=A0A931CPP4_9ACTN|nr:single-stranded DNA-binding protein [Actinoplanes aureus]MBG0568795.1 single-stranded DNA-binding protein [Actinoplanes aureus]
MDFNFDFEGNLAEDADLRFTQSGRSVCRLRVAHNRRRRDNNGEWQNQPAMWVDVTVWGELAERCAGLKKGDTVYVFGRDDLDAWPFVRQEDETPDARLQCTAANIALSMRFKAAQFVQPDTNSWAAAEAHTPEMAPTF